MRGPLPERSGGKSYHSPLWPRRRTPRTQREIAAACGISRSYVSRLEKKALEKLREAMEQHE